MCVVWERCVGSPVLATVGLTGCAISEHQNQIRTPNCNERSCTACCCIAAVCRQFVCCGNWVGVLCEVRPACLLGQKLTDQLTNVI
jgi:hypothetical protein